MVRTVSSATRPLQAGGARGDGLGRESEDGDSPWVFTMGFLVEGRAETPKLDLHAQGVQDINNDNFQAFVSFLVSY